MIVDIEPTHPDGEDGGGGYEFENKVTGGRIPREYIPSVDAGCQDAMEFGVLAGYPMVDIKITLTDGAYHEVDSSEMAFKIAGSMVFKDAARRADPVLMEPVMSVEVTTPEDFMGDVIGDLNSRRGQILAMDERGGARIVRATVPLSEMFGYVGDLRSKTQGRASYSMQFDSYAEVPEQRRQGDHRQGTRRVSSHQPPTSSTSLTGVLADRPAVTVKGGQQWLRPSSSGPSRTSTSAPSVTSTMARRR